MEFRVDRTVSKNEIYRFLNPEVNDASTYHLNQSLIAIGSGGIVGSSPH